MVMKVALDDPVLYHVDVVVYCYGRKHRRSCHNCSGGWVIESLLIAWPPSLSMMRDGFAVHEQAILIRDSLHPNHFMRQIHPFIGRPTRSFIRPSTRWGPPPSSVRIIIPVRFVLRTKERINPS